MVSSEHHSFLFMSPFLATRSRKYYVLTALDFQKWTAQRESNPRGLRSMPLRIRGFTRLTYSQEAGMYQIGPLFSTSSHLTPMSCATICETHLKTLLSSPHSDPICPELCPKLQAQLGLDTPNPAAVCPLYHRKPIQVIWLRNPAKCQGC